MARNGYRIKHRARAALPLLVVAALLLAGGSTPAQAHPGTPPPPSPCPGAGKSGGPLVHILSPRANTAINLARTPAFAIAGVAREVRRDPVRTVEVYADGVKIGNAAVGAARWFDERGWRLMTSAAPGTHTIVACAHSASGRTSADSVVVRVTAPPRTAPVVAPDVTTLRAADLAAITAITDTTVAFRGRPAVEAGQVIVGGISTATPDGLLRRVTRIDRTRTGYLAMTKPAGLDDVLWQADIHLVGVPLEPESGTGVVAPRIATEARPSASVAAGAAATAAAALDYTSSLSIKAGVDGASGSGSLTVTASTGVHVFASIDVDIVITPTWKWGSLPTITVDTFNIQTHASASTDAQIEAKGEGTVHYTSPILRSVKLNRIPLPGPLPLYLRVRADLRLGASADLTADVKFGSHTSSSASFGVAYRNGTVVTTGDSSFVPSLTSRPDGDKKVEGTVKIFAEADVHPSLNLLNLPDLILRPGAQADLTLPCPGKAVLSAYLESEIDGPFAILGLRSSPVHYELPRASVKVYEGKMFGCDFMVDTTALPDGEVDAPYPPFTVEAKDGEEPYVWIANGLPPGLSISPEGVISGRPTTAGEYPVQLAVADDDGTTAEATIALTIRPKLEIVTEALSGATEGTSYASSVIIRGGGDHPVWTIVSGSLPGGLSLDRDTGRITGVPAATGTTEFTVSVTDELGGGDTAHLKIVVEPKLPDPVDTTPPPPPTPLPPCAGACATTWGDPHLVTYDGATYDFQQAGEFVATRSTVDDFQVQVRQQPWYFRGTVAVNTAIAFAVAGHRVGVYLVPTGTRTLVDGHETTPATTGTALPGGGTVALDPGSQRETITWPDGSAAVITYVAGSYLTLSLNLVATRRGTLTGLLGNADGVAADDLVTRSGVQLPFPAPIAQLYGAYSASWRLSQPESLFDYAAGQDTGTYTDLSFPSAIITVADLPAANRAAAEALCRAAGVPEGPTLDNCVLDVTVSGDPNAATAAVLAGATSQPTGTVLAGSAVGDAWTDPSGGSGTAELTYGHIGCTSLNSRQLCSGGLWPVLDDAPWIWTGQFVTDGQQVATFTKTVTLTAAQAARPLTLYAHADNEVVASVNGGPPVLYGTLGTTPASAVLHLHAGDNTLSFRTTNYFGFDPNGNPAGLAWKLVLG